MEDNSLQNKVIYAAKWSTITEIASKLVSPITNMILARILTPEAFGVIATVTMIISFAEMFADSGFQKYLVQHEFRDENEKYKNANIAFWTNFGISVFLWIVIFLFRENLASLVGNPGLGNVIAIACLQLPLTSFSTIQMALHRRDFDFKTLFIARMIAICIPFVITVPLAFLGLNYWALIIGTLVIQLSNAIVLTVKSKWRPKFYYSVAVLNEMLSFSIWSLIEAISIWLTSWADTFIIGKALNQYYLGIYKTSTSMVNALMSLIRASIIPVLFSTLCRLQDDEHKFNDTFFKFQRLVSIAVFPLGVGVFVFSDLATKIMLGSKWSEASGVIGVWALTSSIMTVFGYFCSEVYRAKGRPKLSFVAQILHLIVLVPVCIIAAKYGFWTLVYARAGIRMQFILVHFLVMKFAIGISIRQTIINVLPTAISAAVMGIIGYMLLKISDNILWGIISIILCALFYFAFLYLFPDMRNEIWRIIRNIIPQRLINLCKAKLNKV